MNNKPIVGVWLDHRRAQLFWADEEADIEMQEIKSEFQEEGEPTDNVEPATAPGHVGGGVEHARLENRRSEQLKHYYKRLDKVLRKAERIYLFGPGQAKKELAKFLEQDKGLRARIEGVENADKKLTQNQKAAQVRDFFDIPRSVI
jgi:hypothetical protein